MIDALKRASASLYYPWCLLSTPMTRQGQEAQRAVSPISARLISDL